MEAHTFNVSTLDAEEVKISVEFKTSQGYTVRVLSQEKKKKKYMRPGVWLTKWSVCLAFLKH